MRICPLEDHLQDPCLPGSGIEQKGPGSPCLRREEKPGSARSRKSTSSTGDLRGLLIDEDVFFLSRQLRHWILRQVSFLNPGRKREEKCRAFAFFAFRTDLPAMPFHDLPDIGQSDTCPLEFPCPVQALEHLEQTLYLPFGKSDTIILDAEGVDTVRELCFNPDRRVLDRAGELESIGQEIRENHA